VLSCSWDRWCIWSHLFGPSVNKDVSEISEAEIVVILVIYGTSKKGQAIHKEWKEVQPSRFCVVAPEAFCWDFGSAVWESDFTIVDVLSLKWLSDSVCNITDWWIATSIAIFIIVESRDIHLIKVDLTTTGFCLALCQKLIQSINLFNIIVILLEHACVLFLFSSYWVLLQLVFQILVCFGRGLCVCNDSLGFSVECSRVELVLRFSSV